MGKKRRPNTAPLGADKMTGNAANGSAKSKAKVALDARDANQALAQIQGSHTDGAETKAKTQRLPRGRRKPKPALSTAEPEKPLSGKVSHEKPNKSFLKSAPPEQPVLRKSQRAGSDKQQKQPANRTDQPVSSKSCSLRQSQANASLTQSKSKRTRKKKTQADQGTMPGIIVPRWDTPVTPVTDSTCGDSPRNTSTSINTSDTHDGRYGVTESKTRLEQQGYHPKVTHLSPEELYAKWVQLAESRRDKPTIDEDFGDLVDHPDVHLLAAGLKKDNFTHASIFLNPDYHFGTAAHCLYGAQDPVSGTQGEQKPNLLSVLDNVDTGPFINTCIFHKGLEAVKALALSSKSAWRNIAATSNIWNFTQKSFEQTGFHAVFVAVNPDYNIQQFRHSRDKKVVIPGDNLPTMDLCKEAEAIEDDIFISIRLGHLAYRFQNGEWSNARSSTPKYWPLLKSIPPQAMELLDLESQFVSTMPGDAKHQAPNLLNCYALRSLICKLHQKREKLEVLYFVDIPLLDRRLLSIILRGMNKVTTVGIYNCPLLGFSDILDILDIIFAVNKERVAEGIPEISSLDWSPRHETGMPFKSEGAAEYGISWEPYDLDVFQRGFYGILLRAFMKSQSMGLKLLFDKDSAFRDFLFRIPNLPFGVPTFLDGLYRYLDLVNGGAEIEGKRKHALKRAIFDILKPVRMQIEDGWERDHPKWYQFHMGVTKNFCSVCGYVTLPQFHIARDTQMCAVCRMQDLLDRENHGLRRDKMKCIDALVKEQDPTTPDEDQPNEDQHPLIQNEPNDEAPILEAGSGLLKKVSASSRRQGEVHFNDLPTLAELAVDDETMHRRVWSPFYIQCDRLDLWTRTMRFCIKNGFPISQDQETADMPDHVFERQAQSMGKYGSYTWSSAMEAHKWHVERGWVPGKPERLSHTLAPGFW